MEVAVPHMAQHGRDDAGGLDIGARFDHALRQLRYRHAHIGDHGAAARPQRHGGVQRVMPRLPQPRAVFGLGRPFELRGAVFGGDGLDHLGLLLGALVGPVEFEEQRGLLGIGQLGVAVHAAHFQLVHEFDARHRDAHLDGLRRRGHGRLNGRERTHCRSDGLRHAVQPEMHLGDDAERAFGTDEQARQVVTGRGLARARAGMHHAAVGQHDGEAEHVVAHGAVAHRGRAGRARGGHAAQRGVGARVDGKEQARILDVRGELLARHAGLDAHVHVFGADFEHAVHGAHVDAQAAMQRGDVAFQRGADAERRDGQLVAHAHLHGGHDVGGGLREHHGIRRMRQVIGLVLAVALQQRLGGGQAIAEQRAQFFERTGQRGGRDGHLRRPAPQDRSPWRRPPPP